LRLEQATIAEWQGASEDQKYVAKPTQPKTDSSSCFGMPKSLLFKNKNNITWLLR
jgi:hypothetical protein